MTARKPFDLTLYLVVDRVLCGARGLAATVEAAIAGGVTMLQLRSPRARLAEVLEDAVVLRNIARRHGIPFIVNDHVDVALAIQADGVHVGQGDLPAHLARSLLGPDRIVGLSITNAHELGTINSDAVDYIGLGPVFATQTKADAAPALGLDAFATIRAQIALPVVAIGGLDAGNAGAVRRAGADGIAVVSAICAAPDAREAAANLRTAMAGAGS